jgi:L-serine dehydratase
METISIFDIFKIGVGPSSSHTMGPWRSALNFIKEIKSCEYDRISCTLYGSLSKTGLGHKTDVAIQLGLLGYQFKSIDTEKIANIIEEVKQKGELLINNRPVEFDAIRDLEFSPEHHAEHPNTLCFSLWNKGHKIKSTTYFSIGGGFVEEKGKQSLHSTTKLPHPIENGRDLRTHLMDNTHDISTIVLKNELTIRSKDEIDEQIKTLFDVMKQSILRGLTTEGELPGGLNVKRRAAILAKKLLHGADFNNFEELSGTIQIQQHDFKSINNWISCFALAINEDNASMGRIVTSPTNGAAGVIPAVFLYYLLFCAHQYDDAMLRFFCTAGEIGSLFKKGATISAAVGGCQAEIGVSSAMAAAGLTEILGGTADQALMAAEIAMEHHLGMTCDPIKGLVQVPCIERNAMGAIKAITAANLALDSNPKNSIVSLDAVIRTMWETSIGMRKEFKETSEGGLAYNVPVIYPEC